MRNNEGTDAETLNYHVSNCITDKGWFHGFSVIDKKNLNFFYTKFGMMEIGLSIRARVSIQIYIVCKHSQIEPML